MAQQQLIVVHGMGQHTAASFRDEVLVACRQAFGLYDSLQGIDVEDRFAITPVAYDDIFDDFRAGAAERSVPMAERLGAIQGALPLAAGLARRIAGIESQITDDDFFRTHWLDVLLYRFTVLSEPVRLRLAEAVGAAIAAHGPANVHVLGHSLGTAVVHDTLAKAYGPDQLRDPDGNDHSLSTRTHRLGSVHMVANVSRVLESFIEVKSSVVRPGELGCTSDFLEYRHALDPITWVRPFDPTDNGRWVSHAVFRSAYLLARPTSVTQANTHAIGHYLLNPVVHLPLFRILFRFRPRKREVEEASERYFALTAQAKAERLEESLEEFSPADRDGLRDLVRAAQQLKALVESFGERF
ncbi:MAG: hypothetical protein U5K43_13485 [Halofilum sp. (in: g-proteobacteria)]|nr:hypothetical protein [Halofilum sp. (in: g-proteobacteria)]